MLKTEKLLTKKRGSIPSPTGSYLAACVFYSALYGESAQGNPYQSSLSDDIAQKLQKIAWETVIEFNK